VEQTAESLRLTVAEKVLSGNLLWGTMFRHAGEVPWRQNASVISTVVKYKGTNSVYIDASSSTAYGLVWPELTAGTYTFSFFLWTLDGAGAAKFRIRVEYFNSAGTSLGNALQSDPIPTANNEWQKIERTFTIPATAASAYIAIYPLSSTKFYVARPMLSTDGADWQRSERDYDAIGGNLLDGTRDLAVVGNLSQAGGTVTAQGYGSDASVAGSATTGTLDLLRWSIPYDLNTDYTLSLMAKGSGRLRVYLYNSSNDVAAFVETSTQATPADGYADLALTSAWKQHTVRWRTKGTRTQANASVLIRVMGSSTATVAHPKLETGCTATEYTDSKDEMVSAKALLDTGVDIRSRSITLTADKVRVRNNSGAETLLLNADGTLRTEAVIAQGAKFVNVDVTGYLESMAMRYRHATKYAGPTEQTIEVDERGSVASLWSPQWNIAMKSATLNGSSIICNAASSHYVLPDLQDGTMLDVQIVGDPATQNPEGTATLWLHSRHEWQRNALESIEDQATYDTLSAASRAFLECPTTVVVRAMKPDGSFYYGMAGSGKELPAWRVRLKNSTICHLFGIRTGNTTYWTFQGQGATTDVEAQAGFFIQNLRTTVDFEDNMMELAAWVMANGPLTDTNNPWMI
jgi:hypothetical protein